MKSLLGPLFVCVCALVLVAEGFPNSSRRLKREVTSEASSTSTPSDSSSSTTEESTGSDSTSSTSTPAPNNEFGFGAAAGIGGLRRGVSVGNFDTEIKSDAYSPWGAFAGINLGNGGRIGAGCSGLNCGVQLGHLVLGTPHLLGVGRNILNHRQNGSGPEGKKATELTERSETNLSNGAHNPEDLRLIFRDAFRGFRETLQSFFRAPVTHFIKKHVHIDNSTESVVGAVKPVPSASTQQTYRIQLTPPKPSPTEDKDPKQNQQENELD